MKLIWSEGAFSDWEGIARYIATSFGKEAFDKFSEATDATEEQILNMPESGVPQHSVRNRHLGLRYVLVNRLSKMIYHISDDTIYIDVFWDTRQSPQRLTKRLAQL